MARFIAKIDEWMEGTVWLTRCSNYFRAANGRVVTQWPRSARAFWGMTRRFGPRTTPSTRRRQPALRRGDRHASGRTGEHGGMIWHRLDPALRHLAEARTDLSADVLASSVTR